MEKFDVFIVNPIPAKLDDLTDPITGSGPGWLPLDIELADARGLVKQILKQKGNAYVMPARYRMPKITLEQARIKALAAYEEKKKGGAEMDPLDQGRDDLLWWTFYADVPDAEEKDLYPGRYTFSIDKLTGELRTDEQLKNWLKLSTDE